MEDRIWGAIALIAILEGIVFHYDQTLGWELVLTLFVAAIQEYLRRRRES
jgi:hypothetical protein